MVCFLSCFIAHRIARNAEQNLKNSAAGCKRTVNKQDFSSNSGIFGIIMKTEFMEACNMKILVIEDEKLLADSIKTLLEGKGFEV